MDRINHVETIYKYALVGLLLVVIFSLGQALYFMMTDKDDDKRTARLNLISHLLSVVPYEHVHHDKRVKLPPRQRRKYKRPPKRTERLVPTRYLVD